MSRTGLQIGTTTKFIDSPAAETIANCDGMFLQRAGAFIFSGGAGANTGNRFAYTQKYMPPFLAARAAVSTGNCCGIVDTSAGIDMQYCARDESGDTTKMGGGAYWTGNQLNRFPDARPFMVGFYGDTPTANTTAGIKVGSDTRTGFLLTGEDNGNSLYQGIERIVIDPPIHNPYGVVAASRWADVVILSLSGVFLTTTATDLVNLGILPTGWRPKHPVPLLILDMQSMKYPYAYVNTDGNIYLIRDHTQSFTGDGCAIWSTADASPSQSAIITANLNVKGTKKTLMRVNPAVQLTSTMQTCTNASGVTGTAYVYRMGNFVFGHSLGFSANISSIVTDQNLFQVPIDYMPSETVYSTGCGAYFNNGDPSKYADWERCRYIVDTDRWVKISTSTKKSVNTCTLCFYYYCNA
jgi:hypothetical protein